MDDIIRYNLKLAKEMNDDDQCKKSLIELVYYDIATNGEIFELIDRLKSRTNYNLLDNYYAPIPGKKRLPNEITANDVRMQLNDWLNYLRDMYYYRDGQHDQYKTEYRKAEIDAGKIAIKIAKWNHEKVTISPELSEDEVNVWNKILSYYLHIKRERPLNLDNDIFNWLAQQDYLSNINPGDHKIFFPYDEDLQL